MNRGERGSRLEVALRLGLKAETANTHCNGIDGLIVIVHRYLVSLLSLSVYS